MHTQTQHSNLTTSYITQFNHFNFTYKIFYCLNINLCTLLCSRNSSQRPSFITTNIYVHTFTYTHKFKNIYIQIRENNRQNWKKLYTRHTLTSSFTMITPTQVKVILTKHIYIHILYLYILSPISPFDTSNLTNLIPN